MCKDGGSPVGNRASMRVIGLLCIIFGAVAIGVGFAAFTFFKDYHAGCWWGALLTVASGGIALCAINRCITITICIMACFGIAIGAVAALFDGLNYAIVKSFEGCCNGDHDCTGSNHGIADASWCIYNSGHSVGASTCYCATSDGSCFHHDLSYGTDCDTIFSRYEKLMGASTAFLAIGVVMLLLLAVYSCVTLCCASALTHTRRRSSETGRRSSEGQGHAPTVSEPLLNPTAPPVEAEAEYVGNPTAPPQGKLYY